MSWLANLIPAAVNAVGSWFGYKSSKERNVAQAQAAADQQAFQERMARNAHQYEVADLKAAGLNPILSAKYGGSATPPGAMPNLVNTIEGIQSGSSSALNFLTTKLTGKQINFMREQIRKEAANAREAEARADVAKAEADFVTENANSVFSAKHFGSVTRSLRQAGSFAAKRVSFTDFGKGIGQRFWNYYYNRSR